MYRVHFWYYYSCATLYHRCFVAVPDVDDLMTLMMGRISIHRPKPLQIPQHPPPVAAGALATVKGAG